MTATILVTGASGTIGGHLLQALRAAGAPVAAMSSRADASFGDVALRQADFNDVEALTRAFAGVRTLFLLLPIVPNKKALAENAIAAARAAGVRHIVRASGIGADPASPYALMKLQGEIDAQVVASGIDYTLLRPAGFMQNLLTYQSAQVKTGTLYLAHADARQPLIDARDIAAAAARILLAPQAHAARTYGLTGAEALSGHDVAAHLSQTLDRDIRFVPVSFEQANEALRAMAMPPLLIQWMDSLNRYICAGEGADVSADIPTLLGRAPITFAQFAREHASAWR